MPAAQPNFSPKKFANIQLFAAAFAGTAVLICTVLRYFSLQQFFTRAGLIVLYTFATAWAYRKFFNYVQKRPAEREHLLQIVAGGLGFCVIYPYFFLLISGTSMAQASATFLMMIPIMIGIAITRLGFVRRTGDTLHCPHCEYPYEFPNDADAPTRCPECGRGWLGLLKKGRKVKSAKLIISGVLIAIFATLILNPIFYIGAFATSLPTPLLYASSYILPTPSHTAWDELATRKLSPTWTRLMAKRVMGLRKHNSHEVGSRWFESQLTAGTIPADLKEQYFVEGFNAELIVPDHVKVGETFTALLRVRHASSGSGLINCVMFSGYFVDDFPAPIGRKDESQFMHALYPASFSPYNDALPEDLIAKRTGTVTIRCVYWLVYQPSFADQLKWQPDGTPGPLPAAVWSKRYELTKTIRVE